MSSPDYTSVQKGMSFLFLNIFLFIFAALVLTKVDIMYKKAQAETQRVSAEWDWKGYLYHQDLQNKIQSRE